jgi:hypothetical protein
VNRPRINLQKLARIDRDLALVAARQAELLAERSTIMGQLAEDDADVATGRKRPATHVAALPMVTASDEEAAAAALRTRGTRRRA